MANDHASVAIEARQTTHDAQIIRKVPVAVQLHKIGENLVDVVERIRPLRMPCNLCDLPRRQIAVNVFGKLLALL